MDSFSHGHFFLLEYQAIFCEMHETHEQNTSLLFHSHTKLPPKMSTNYRSPTGTSNASDDQCLLQIFLSYISTFSFFHTTLFFPFFFFTDLNGPEAVCNRPKARTRMYVGTTAPKPYCLQRWESQQDLNAPACINSPGEEFKTPSEVAFTSNLCA